MKKKILIIMALCLFMCNVNRAEYRDDIIIPLTATWDDPSDPNNPIAKSPTLPLYITQNGNVLTLPTTPVGYTLQLRDEYNNVVYSSYIPAGTTQIVLPSTLSGGFEIRLVADTYYYIGYISL